MICLIWESKARDQRKSAFVFCPCLRVVSVYMLVTFTLPMIYFCFCFFVFGCEPMICLNCERKEDIKENIFFLLFFCRYFWERENSSHIGGVYCIDIFGCIYGHLLDRWDWDYNTVPWRICQNLLDHLGAVWSRFFHHPIFITHYLSLNFSHLFGIITQFSSLNIFHTICGTYMSIGVTFFFFSTQTHRS